MISGAQASAAACACLFGLHLRVDKEKPAFSKFGTDQHVYTTSNNSTMDAKRNMVIARSF